jgi:carbamate kinase
MSKKTAVVALGGNALIVDPDHQSYPDQFGRMRLTAVHIADMVERGWSIAVTHGNGPQVGFCLLSSELSRHVIDETPMEVCVADTQGSLGYMIQQQLRNEFYRRERRERVVTVVTQVLVDAEDEAFDRPTKPVGSWYDKEQALALARERGWTVAEDAGRGWRRVVASPMPQEILEVEAIQALVERGFIVIGAGGGGIPVIMDEKGRLQGAAAVIDKDHASSLLAVGIQADLLLISTGVEKVSLNYRQPDQIDLDRITLAQAERYLAEGHFAVGSMKPKIEASIRFVRETGKQALITSPESIGKALDGEMGTRIVP